MQSYAAAVRHLFLSGPVDPARRHALARAVLAMTRDALTRHEAFRLAQEAFDRDPGAFRERVYRMWQALPPEHKPELAVPVDSTAPRIDPPATAPDTTGLTRHYPRRRALT
ncbi:hypothetical protein WK57_11225 [Burkholderia ubonensis]|uniref:Uncharacterized protein n=1 Tax=Burkholderia ubonensis TaxID=101571 RepID=A0AA40UYZ1_9BURK|nr:hypothetical protein WI85_28255 [Burkholderia ubonensis]KWZ61074.1 hypothetical protein WK57_11225 [Burkholderia ubonensis]